MKILLRALALVGVLLAATTASAAAAPLKVSSYDINYGVGVDGKLDLDRTAAAITATGADVIGLQAVDKYWSTRSGNLDEPAELARRLNMHVVYGPNLDNAPVNAGDPRRQYGVAILSKFPIVSSTHTLLPRPTNGEQRGLLEAVVDADGTKVRVATTHLHTTAVEREAQVAAIIAKLSGSAEPVVITGVLNAASTAPELAPILAAYRDTWKIKGVGDGFTAPAANPTGRTVYVLAAKGIGVLSAVLGDRTASTYIPVTVELDPSGQTGDTGDGPIVTPTPTPTPTPEPDAGGGAHPDAPGTPLHVTSYNIAHGAGYNAQNQLVFDLDRTIDTLRAIGSDVIALQEVDKHWSDRSNNLDEPKVLSEALGMHVVYAPNLDNPPNTPGGPRSQYGTAILSKYPILESRNTLLPRPGNGEQRGLLEAVIDVNGLRVRIANTHMSTLANERTAQTARIMELLADSKEPVVLLGDLNATPESSDLAALWTRYRDSWKLGGVGSPFTYPGNFPDRRIDFIALSSGINVRSAEVVNTLASDHRPYTARLAITTSTQTTATVGGTVPATLSLSLGTPGIFAPFQPGVERTYTAGTTATVTSTAGEATLSVSEPGHLRNGAFSLPEPLQVTLTPPSWTRPVTNAPVTIGYRQHIGSSDALRTGTYAQTLTFTLSTTTP
ncbi:endonuclease/exonuclease/phosphatase family protein [Solirubrobacter phytolaccae]|uniref:Endonuclease/exonuclease/phosphatase family protein n=1 Tax=Solirubrobacter phytolaccae TaxID=1404360 RepID=A0A9X3S9J6_9ACTN|nr:endonuclease/exonuclease/phosphatase family protein [Solirubrobacter phytolaccae]MDA0179315.1 endonuclease/exonuclease/phosphatase family protein [Solirubrobacter phytolaccae]